ncbi:VPS10 domain-containing protein [Portibacter marinus]|uniref:VPS10 domain-containing protein n=1 Tax=Portibacter marinus TaxID=2898660 RepID=UPI001F38546F|nr:glycosyl hydrolase [Portibacter marinus]
MRIHFTLLFALTLFLYDFNSLYAQQLSNVDEEAINTVQWRQVGPFRGGRAGTIVGNPKKTNEYIMGTAGGGVWRTKDGGNTWSCISDGFFGGSIGAVAMAPSDPNVLYVGEGEQTLRGNVSSGNGMWKSTDGGTTWTHIGLKGTEHIARVRVHPTNPDIVYVAAIGNLWKPNKERGVYKTTDGGTTWEKILYESDKAGAGDLILDPNNPRIIYASTWEMKRNGYRMDSGGPGSKLWKSTDSGESWTDITASEGLPKGTLGIIGITVSPLNSDRIWTIIEANDGGVFRSDDAGKTWTKTSANRELRQRAWYYSRIYADTQLEDRVYVLNVGFWRSNDGGKTYERIQTPHGDHHDLWINPGDNEIMAIADDGGGQVSYDAGENWTTYHNQPTAQFYRVTTDNHFPFRIYGAQQDNSAIRISHRSSENAITEQDWESTAGGESAHLAPDPDDPDIVYGGTYKGYMMRKDHSNGQTRSTNVWPDNPAGSGAEIMKYRFNWNFPVMFSPHNSEKLYAGSNYLHVSTNEGQSWKTISPDLTRNDPETIKSSGGPITQDNTGAEFYANIFAMAESPLEEGVIWVGSDDGLVHITRDGGENWEEVTPKGSPKLNMMNCIDVHPFKKGAAYLAATHYKFGDYTPYLYKTEDYGKNWTLITDGIPSNYYTRAIRADQVREGLLYAGTEWGMFVSWDDGENWQPLQLNLPITSIRDLHVKDNMLIAATHGRSFWMIDDLGPLQQIDEKILQSSHHLYQPKPAYRMAQGGWGSPNSKLEGTNHPNGVLFNYFIQDYNDSMDVELRIEEVDGQLIRSFTNHAKDKDNKLEVDGRFIWDMRYEGFKEFDGMVLYSSPNNGPKAVPGQYVAKLIVDDMAKDQEFEITKDPRLESTQEDLEEQFEYLSNVRDKVSEAHQAIIDIRSIKSDIDYFEKKLADNPDYKEFLETADRLVDELEVIENNIHMTKNQARQDPLNYGIRINNRLAFLLADQQRGDYKPTDQAVAFYKEVSAELDKELSDLDQLINEGLVELNKIGQPLGVRIMSDRIHVRP